MDTHTPSPDDFIVTWDQFHADTRTLASALGEKGPWGSIVAITRGGLIPAAIIAQELDIRIIDTVCVTSYHNKQQIPLTVLKNIEHQENRLLFIDDLVDSGETAKTIKRMFPNSFYAVVYAKPDGLEYVDCFVDEVQQDIWIVFPWDD